jgi:hypothetical protein
MASVALASSVPGPLHVVAVPVVAQLAMVIEPAFAPPITAATMRIVA